ncbi:MAG: 2,3-bisphosphoglycerate-dependent phosphoglycerate mutase [Chlamydiia bacterium]|nr:2,3-bisphosphoglycerate-dependent phosphoglycerate mutase [Chlamydiia bacterium]MCP5509621.1 2,3-bisphosphoglycerate-dependent phosphoglycerate mutase [Chlamydiales bacterium]
MAQLVLLRHGQSVWNAKNLFTGWVDIPLSPKGIDEALKAGQKIRDIPFDVIFVSSLTRSQLTAMLAMSVHSEAKVPCVMHPHEGKQESWGKSYGTQELIPTYVAWELNERMYGQLQGMNKDDARAKYGKEQVHIWRRSYATSPPGGESLKDTAARTLPYFQSTIVPHLDQGKNVLISAHGNSLRAIIMQLDNLSEEDVVKLEIPTGLPLFYTYKDGQFSQ